MSGGFTRTNRAPTRGLARWLAGCVLVLLLGLAGPASAGFQQVTLKPSHDTWTTHDDKTVHGGEALLKVGIQPQACDPKDTKNACTKLDPKMECCPAKGDTVAYCALPGSCDTAKPTWPNYRHFRTYLRFDLAGLPKGTIAKAELRLRVGKVTEKLGPPAKAVATRLIKIGLPDAYCEWKETELNDTNGTTWNSLPHNVSIAPGQVWIFDVTKAVRDWQTGNSDKTDSPLEPNCGFHLYDNNFGNKDGPIERWIEFSSKEGTHAPELVVNVALDEDKDGYTADVDCNDMDKSVHPGAVDLCADQADTDCSGKADDEVCDGVDNDCDGEVDEGDAPGTTAPCPGEGKLCANHKCVTVCKNDCGSAYHTECVWDDSAKVWDVFGCGKYDGDPCWDWKKFTPCDPGLNCQYGSCSFNCVDTCEGKAEVGAKSCVKDKLGIWHVAECGNWDVDPCLEDKFVSNCAPGGTCTNAVCAGGCSGTCSEAGKVTCKKESGAKDQAIVCSDSDGDGCLDLNAVVHCDNGCKEPIGCILPGAKPPEIDAGPADDAAEDAGDSGYGEMIGVEAEDTGGKPEAIADLPGEVVLPDLPPAEVLADLPGPELAPIDNGLPPPDGTAGLDAPQLTCDACPTGSTCQFGQCVAIADAGGGKTTTAKTKKSEGCSAGPASATGPLGLLLAGLAGLLMVLGRRRHEAR